MKVLLVGADFEENIGVGMIAAVTREAGHIAQICGYNTADDVATILQWAAREAPEVLGLSIQFQHRAAEFLHLARKLRAQGYAGHITCGGQFPSLAWKETLVPGNGVDSVVLYDGERTFPELLAAIERGADLSTVPGLALRNDKGEAFRTAGRRLEEQLDTFPFPIRYRPHSKHMGIDFIPVMGGRGCWGSCSYCSITSYFREARAHGGGKTVRLRSPENIAEEMAIEWHRSTGNCIFCFHDDNLLLPRPSDTIARLRSMRQHLDALGVGSVGLIGKCRPDCMTKELAKELRSLGVLRLYVGVENASDAGAEHFARTSQAACVDEALAACRDAGIFVCYNLLLFEPDATIEDVRSNVRFIREHAEHPVNFCRAEPYFGTPLHKNMASRGMLDDAWMGFNYCIEDKRTELLFRICSAAFRQRNFDPEGVGNRYMSLGYTAKLLEFYYPERDGRRAKLLARASELTRSIALDTADWLDRAVTLATTVALEDEDRIARETAVLGLAIAAADAVWHAALDELGADMMRYVKECQRAPEQRQLPARLRELAKKAAAGISVAAWATSMIACVDPVPRPGPDAGPDVFVVDPVPPDARPDVLVSDPVPPDARPDIFVVDPPPPDASMDVQPDRPQVVDPPPPDVGPVGLYEDATAPPETPVLSRENNVRRLAVVDQWRDTSPTKTIRSTELPLHSPPAVQIQAKKLEEGWLVSLVGGPSSVSIRWEGTSEFEGDGREVRWAPVTNDEQLRVAVRSRGGVSILAVRAAELPA